MNTEHALPAAINDIVARLVADTAAQSVLVIGSRAIPTLAKHPNVRYQTIATADPSASTHVDLAIVDDALADLPRATAVALLASLRDVQARRVLVIDVERKGGPQGWQDADFRSFGFRRLFSQEEAGQRWRLHEFSIDTYKTTPDWLNARHWAHPQRFDKFRW